MIRAILVPVDLSDLSTYAIHMAETVAASTQAKIHVIHVVNLPSHILLTKDGDLLEDGEMDTRIPREKKAAAEIKLQELVKSGTADYETCVCFGHVNEETVKYAKKHDSDLIIMASHGISSLSERIMGSHTEYVAMHSTVPVLSIKQDPGTSVPKSIVFAGDFKEEDIPNCEVVLELQKAFHASITLLRVNTPRNFLSNDEALKHMHSFAEKHQITHAEFAVFDDVDVEDGILHFSAEHHIDMLVIGSMQRTGLNKMINGCVSADLVNHATKPLLTFALKA